MSDESKTGFHPIVDLIIARMGTHPEEVQTEVEYGVYKTQKAALLAHIRNDYKDCFSEAELAALKAAVNKAHLDVAHKRLMAVLLEEDKLSEDYQRQYNYDQNTKGFAQGLANAKLQSTQQALANAYQNASAYRVGLPVGMGEYTSDGTKILSKTNTNKFHKFTSMLRGK